MEVRVTWFQPLLAAGSCCGCVAVAGITSFMQSFAAGRVSYEDWETRVNNQCFGCSKVGQETCDQFTINCGELRFLMTVLVKLQPSNLRELCFASDMTTGLTMMTWSSQTVEITDVAPTVRHLDVLELWVGRYLNPGPSLTINFIKPSL